MQNNKTLQIMILINNKKIQMIIYQKKFLFHKQILNKMKIIMILKKPMKIHKKILIKILLKEYLLLKNLNLIILIKYFKIYNLDLMRN